MKTVLGDKKIDERTFEFALKIVQAYKFLVDRKEFVLSKQLLRAGTEIGCRMSDVGCRMSDVGCRKSEVGSRKSEVGSRRSEVGGREGTESDGIPIDGDDLQCGHATWDEGSFQGNRKCC